jgi:hypothetical protein
MCTRFFRERRVERAKTYPDDVRVPAQVRKNRRATVATEGPHPSGRGLVLPKLLCPGRQSELGTLHGSVRGVCRATCLAAAGAVAIPEVADLSDDIVLNASAKAASLVHGSFKVTANSGAFSGSLPSVSEEQVRCNGGFEGDRVRHHWNQSPSTTIRRSPFRGDSRRFEATRLCLTWICRLARFARRLRPSARSNARYGAIDGLAAPVGRCKPLLEIVAVKAA